MRKIFVIASVLAFSTTLFGQGRLYVSKVTPSETPVLEDGEIAVAVEASGAPVKLQFGDGTTAGGRTILDTRALLRTSSIDLASDRDFTIALSGSAFWTNGLIAGFPPTGTYDPSIAGTVTVTLVSSRQKILSLGSAAVLQNASHSYRVADDRLSATAVLMHQEPPPGFTATHSLFIERFDMLVYSDPESMGSTQDMRGLTILVNHPGQVDGGAYTNTADYLPITTGWYSNHVQEAVALWADHPARASLTVRNGMTLDDGLNLHERFRWAQQANGYLSLAHESDAVRPVMTIEAMDPYPWLTTSATGTISTMQFTTNGLSGVFRIQTCSNLASAAWVNTAHMATNSAPAGYMSITASNTLAGSVSYWRVSVSNAVQAEARANFAIPVKAPRFELADGVYLSWSNSTLMVHAGASNGVVGVTW